MSTNTLPKKRRLNPFRWSNLTLALLLVFGIASSASAQCPDGGSFPLPTPPAGPAVCPVDLIEIEGKTPKTDGVLTTQIWTPGTTPAACCGQLGPTPANWFNAFNGTDPLGYPQQQNGVAGTVENFSNLGIADSQDGLPTAASPAGREQAQQDGWLVVPPGVDCVVFDLTVGGADGSRLYIGTSINDLTFIAQYRETQAPAAGMVDYTIPATAATFGCGWRVLRIRHYHYDGNTGSNTRVQWDIGNGTQFIPSRFLQSLGTLDPTNGGVSDNFAFDANIPTEEMDITRPAYADANGDLFNCDGTGTVLNPLACEAQGCTVEANVSFGACQETCGNGVDEDGDGLVDGDDPDVDGTACLEVPECDLSVVEITPLCPVTDGVVRTELWVGAAANNGFGQGQQSIHQPFNTLDANCLPQHPNASSSVIQAPIIGINDNDAQFGFDVAAGSPDEQAQQDGWLVVPPGVGCIEFKLGGPDAPNERTDASSLYLGEDFATLELVGENTNPAPNANPNDDFSYNIPCTVAEFGCGWKALRFRFYHHDATDNANTRVQWNLFDGNGFVFIPAKFLQSVATADGDENKPDSEQVDPNAATTVAVLDANGNYFAQSPNFGMPITAGALSPEQVIFPDETCNQINVLDLGTCNTAFCAEIAALCAIKCPDPMAIRTWNNLPGGALAAGGMVDDFDTGFCEPGTNTPITVDVTSGPAPDAPSPGVINAAPPRRAGNRSFLMGRATPGTSGVQYCFEFSRATDFTIDSREHQIFSGSEVIVVEAFGAGGGAIPLVGQYNGAAAGPATVTGNGTGKVTLRANGKVGPGTWWEVTPQNGDAIEQVCVQYFRTNASEIGGRENFRLNICGDECAPPPPYMCTQPEDPVGSWNRLTGAERTTLQGGGAIDDFDTGICDVNGDPITVSIDANPSQTVGGAINARQPRRFDGGYFLLGRQNTGVNGVQYCYTYSEPVSFNLDSRAHAVFSGSENIVITAFSGDDPVNISGNYNGAQGPATITGSGTPNLRFNANGKVGPGLWWEASSGGEAVSTLCVEYFRTNGSEIGGVEPFLMNICGDKCVPDDPIVCDDPEPVTRWNRLTAAERNALNDNSPATVVENFDSGFCDESGDPILIDIVATGAPNSAQPNNTNNKRPRRWGQTSFFNGRETGGNSGNKYCFFLSDAVPFNLDSEEHSFFALSENVVVTAFLGVDPVIVTGQINGQVGPATTTGNGTTQVSFAANGKTGPGTWWEASSGNEPVTQVCVEYYRNGGGQQFPGAEPFTLEICNSDRCVFDDPFANGGSAAGLQDGLGIAKSIAGIDQAASCVAGNIDVVFQYILQNDGTDPLTDLELEDDFGTQFPAAAIIGVVSSATVPTTTGTATFNPNFDGLADPDILTGGTIPAGGTLTVQVTVEMDPSEIDPAMFTCNIASGSGVDGGGSLASGTSNNGIDADPAAAPDCTPLYIPAINVTKQLLDVAEAASCQAGNVDATFLISVQNTGNVDLTNISVLDDFATQIGGAFVDVVAGANNFGGDATTNPSANAGYDGAGMANLLDGTSGTIAPGQTVTFEFTVELDPNAAGVALDIFNTATATANGVDPMGGGILIDPNTNMPYLPTDLSDSGTDPDGQNAGEPGDSACSDDPTPLPLPSINLAKQVTAQACPSASGVQGNFDVTFELEVLNTGNRTLRNIQISEQLANNLGGAFVGIVANPTFVTSTATQNPSFDTFTGTGVDGSEIFADNNGVLNPNEGFTIEYTIEINPNAPGAIIPAFNQAVVTAEAFNNDGTALIRPNGVPYALTDLSDSGDTAESQNAGAPGDSGCEDDPTPVQLPKLELAKYLPACVQPAGTVPGNVLATMTIVFENGGNVDLTNLMLFDDINAQLGNNLIAIQSAPAIVSSTATTNPVVNAGYNGSNAIFSGGGLLAAGQQIVVEMTLELDPNAVGGDLILFNQAIGSAQGLNSMNQLVTTTDLSDSGTDPNTTNPDGIGDQGTYDDPTPILLPGLNVAKSVVNEVPASSGISGNFDITFSITILNTGNVDLTDLTIEDVLEASAFVGYPVGGNYPFGGIPTITATTANENPVLNTSYPGNGNFNIFQTGTGNIGPGQFVSVEFTQEVTTSDPNVQFPIKNSATGDAAAMDPFTGGFILDPAGAGTCVVFDQSDCGSTPESVNGDGGEGDACCLFTDPECADNAQDKLISLVGTSFMQERMDWLANNGGACFNTSDACEPITWTNDFDEANFIPDCGPIAGSITVTFTATDACGEVFTTTATCTIEDTTPPNGLDQGHSNDLNVDCSNPNTDQQIQTWLNFIGTVCISDLSPPITVTNNYDGNLVCGENPVEFNATDACGNSTVAIASIFVTDDENPDFSNGADSPTVDCSASNAVQVFNQWIADNGGAEASDNCSNITWSTIPANPVLNENGCASTTTTTVQFVATDGCGNAATTTGIFTLEVPSFAGPQFTYVPEALTIDCGGQVAFGEAVCVTDCGNLTLTFEDFENSDDCASANTFTRVWTGVDDCGLTATAEQVITIANDSQAPIFENVQADMELTCGETPQFTTPTVTDNCTGHAIDLQENVVQNQLACGIEHVKTWTATDPCGNVSTSVTKITVLDTQAPQFDMTPQNLTINCGANPVFANPIATDDCSGVAFTFNDETVAGNCGSAWSITRTWTATDNCGNVAELAQTITVEDLEAPVISNTLEDLTISCGEPMNFYDIETIDNCSAVTVTHEDVISNETCIGSGYTVTRIFTASDDCGNAATAQQSITVLEDETAPEFTTVLENKTVECGAAMDFETPVAIDNCSNVDLTFAETTTNGTCSAYSVTRTWTAVDGCGNATQIAQTISVEEDAIAPAFTTILADKTVACGAAMDFDTPVATDNCSDIDLTFAETTTNGTCNAYSVTRTWTAMDDCGNATQIAQTISVEEDVTAPAFTVVLEDKTLPCGSDITFENTEAVDACGGVALTFVDVLLSNECDENANYAMQRIWTAIDDCGNESTMVQTVEIEKDVVAPTFVSIPAGGTISCGQDPIFGLPEVTDDCSNVTITHQDATISGDCSASFSFVRTWTATDECGNTTTAQQTFTAEEDTTAPQFLAELEDKTINCDEPVIFDTPQATDICSNVLLTMEDSAEATDCGQILTRTWTAADVCGNAATMSQSITIEDNDAPAIANMPTTLAMTFDEFAQFEMPTLDATDCSSFSTEMTQKTNTTCDEQFHEITWTATDVCGNVSEHLLTIEVTDYEFAAAVENPAEMDCGNAYDFTAATTHGIAPFVYTWSIIGSDEWAVMTDETQPTVSILAGEDDAVVQLLVEDANGCVIEQLIDVQCQGFVNTGEVDKFDYFRLFPNPVNDNLNVHFDLNNSADVVITIHDVVGRQIAYQTQVGQSGRNEIQLNVADFATGTYLIAVQAGEQVQSSKFVKVW